MEEVERTRLYYDGIARGYAGLYHEEQREKIRKILEFLPKERRVLDAGSGDGVLNEFLGEKSELVSCDLSFELLKLNGNFRKVCCSVLNLPFRNGVFDCVCSFSVLQDVPDVRRAVFEIVRVLKDEKGCFVGSFVAVSSKRKEIERVLRESFLNVEFFESRIDVVFVCENRRKN